MRIRSIWPVIMLVLLSFTGIGIRAAESQSNAKSILRFAAYLDSVDSREAIRCAVSTESADLKVLSSYPIAATQPLLVIIDPASFSLSELQRRVTGLIAGLNIALQSRPLPQVRVGLLVFDGILISTPDKPGPLPPSIVSDIMKFVADTSAEPSGDPGRILDLAANLLKKAGAEEQSMDCLLVGKDRSFEREDAEYLRFGVERRLMEVCSRNGSVVHSYLEGEGAIRSICAATGGLVFDDKEHPEVVLGRILDARNHGLILSAQRPAAVAALGKHDLKFRLEDSRGNPISVRAPASIWWNPEDTASPDRESIVEALDWIRRAQRSTEAGDLRVALRFIENAVQLDPCNPAAAYLGAQCSFDLGDYPTAFEYISKALQFAHPSERLLLLYGEISRKIGKAAQALGTFGELPQDDTPKSLEFQVMKARLLSADGREEEAAGLYSEMIREGHRDSQIGAEYGCVLWRMGNTTGASAQIESVLAGDPDNVAALMCAMDIAAARGEIVKALNLGARAVGIQPQNPDVRGQIGKVRMQAHELDAALENYQAAADLAPARRDILLSLADAQLQSGRTGDAQETLRKVLALDPNDTETYESVAKLYSNIGTFDNAASILEQSTALVPDRASALYRSAAELRERRGQYGQALLDYRAALESLPIDRAAALRSEFAQHLAYLSQMLGSPKPPAEGRAEAGGTAAEASPAPASQRGIVVQGGLSLLAGVLGINPASLQGPGAAGTVFSVILDSIANAPPKESSQLQTEIVETYRQYGNLVNYLKQQSLLPAADMGLTRKELVFPIVGDSQATSKTKILLRFFGVKFIKIRQNGTYGIGFSYSTDRTSMTRQRLLRRLGTDIQTKNLKEVRFTIGDEILPAIFDAGILRDKLLNSPVAGTEDLFSALILNPGFMMLYRALEDCSAVCRETLVKVLSPRELAGLKSALADYGRFLKFHEEGLVVPGSLPSWETLVRARHGDAAAFLRAFVTYDNGRLLFTYFALQAATPEAQTFITTTPGGLATIAGLNPPARTGLTSADWRADFARLMRLLSADEKGLFLPVSDRFRRYLLPEAARGQVASGVHENTHLRVTLQDLASLAQLGARTENAAVRTGAGIVELLNYLQQARPGMFNDASVDAIGRNLVNAGVLIDLIWDLDPSADLLARHLDSYSEFLGKTESSWKANGTRTSQAVLFLLTLLRREKVIDLQTGWNLLAAALESFRAKDETEFLGNMSRFLSDRVFPALSGSGSSAVNLTDMLPALAGHNPPQNFLFDGTAIVAGEPSIQLQRMQSSIRQQRVCALPDILSAVRPLSSGQPQTDDLQNLAEILRKLTCAGPLDKAERGRSATGPSDIAKEIDALLRVRKRSAQSTADNPAVVTIPQVVQHTSSLLDAELGVSLLAECYAYYSSPEIAALHYNVNFIRNHDFLASGRQPRAYWPAADLEAGFDKRGNIKGLLSGLGVQIQKLELGPAAQNFGKEPWNRLVPAMLSEMRMTSASLRSDRAQEFVALSTRLGRELLAMPDSPSKNGAWLEKCAGLILSPERKDLLQAAISRDNFLESVRLFSPSELFLLGEAYLLAVEILPESTSGRLAGFVRPAGAAHAMAALGKAPQLSSPTLERLRKIIPPAESPDLDIFQTEVECYGFSAWQRIGLTVTSFRFYEPYEQLDFPSTMELLFGRINDLKIQLAEISYAAGLPAFVAGQLGEMALQKLITDPAAENIQGWQDVIDQIKKLGPDLCRGWIEELLSTGGLLLYPGKATQGGEHN